MKIEEYGNWNLDEVNISLAVMSQRIVRSNDLENISYAHHQLRFLVGLIRREGLALHQKMELQKGCRPIYDCTPHKTLFSRSFFYFKIKGQSCRPYTTQAESRVHTQAHQMMDIALM